MEFRVKQCKIVMIFFFVSTALGNMFDFTILMCDSTVTLSGKQGFFPSLFLCKDEISGVDALKKAISYSGDHSRPKKAIFMQNRLVKKPDGRINLEKLPEIGDTVVIIGDIPETTIVSGKEKFVKRPLLFTEDFESRINLIRNQWRNYPDIDTVHLFTLPNCLPNKHMSAYIEEAVTKLGFKTVIKEIPQWFKKMFGVASD